VEIPGRLPVIGTERLLLRELDARDTDAVFEIFADAEAMRFWSRPPMTDPAEALAMIERSREHFAAREALRWGIARRADDRVIGTHTLFQLDAQNDRAEVGYILDRRHWGMGYMREALGALIDYAFATMRLHRIEADIDPRNAASIRSLEHFGFAREGLLRERWRVGEEVSDSLLMGLLRREWQSRSPVR
jgi:[ribosomal protein S5]-alanine N-acetyltransferase